MSSTNIDAQIRALDASKSDSDLCLLSLDGGGVRGLSSLIILQTLMKRVNAERQKKGRETVKPCQIFDLIGGTSTGGLIAILLGRLELDVDDSIAYYKRFMGSIFSEKKHWFKANVQGKIQNQYDQEILKERIIEILKERGISETEMFDDGQTRPSRTFVVAVRYENKNKVAIRDYTPDGELNHDPATIVQAALATSAASTFFPEVDINGKRYADGGLRANNPVGVVWEQALDVWSPEDDSVEILNKRIKCFVSIGTGVPDYKAIRNSAWGFLTDTLKELCTDTEDKAESFAKQHRDLLRQDRYFRFNVSKGLETVNLEEFEKTATIETASSDYLDGQETKLKREKCSKALSTKEPILNVETDIPLSGLILRNETDILRTECVTSLVSRESSRKAKKILNAIYKPEPGTLTWILNDGGEIARWKSKDRGILWIRGDQGSGKSVAMKELYSRFELERDENQVVIGYFFSNQSEEGGVEDLLRSVLASLLKQCPVLFRGMKTWYHYSFPDGTEFEDWDVVGLQMALDLVLRAEHHQVSILLFVDAINEATDVSMEALIEIFQQLCKDDLHIGLKICFSGRFDTKNQQLASFKFPHLNLESKTNDDISIFVRSRFKGAKIDGPLDELNLLMINLIQRASGSWLWASFATQKLKEASNYGSDVNELKAQLDKFPPEIHNMYEEKVKEVREEHIADLNKALAIAFMAPNTLSVDEFRYAWAYSSDDLVSSDGQFETPSFIPSAEGMKRKITSRCNGLLVVKYEFESENEENDEENLGSSTVQFRHPTVKEYLSTKRSTSDSKLDDLESLQKRGSHMLSLATTRFLRGKEVRSLTRQLKSGVKLRYFDREKVKERMPLLTYSVNYVFDHSDQALRFDSEGKAEILNSWKPEQGLFERWWFIWNSMFREVLFPEGVTLLYMFITIGGTEFVKHLLDADPELDVNAAIPLYGRYIILAAFNEQQDIIRLLLETGADVNASCPRYGDALQLAAASGNIAVVNMLLERGARIAPTGGRFHDPICAAAFSLNPQVLEILFNSASKSGFTSNVWVESKALIWAVQAISDFKEQSTPSQVSQISKIVSILATHGFEYSMVSTVAVPVFWWYLSSGGVDTLKRLQVNIRNVNARSADGITLTHLACLNGTPDTIRYLFEIGADFKMRDKQGRYPIHFAALNKDPQALEFVLSTMPNLNPDQPDSIGVTPLHGAIATGNLDCVRQLMKAGADFSIDSIEGFTILHFAMFSSNSKVLGEIQNFASINIDAKDRWGRTALHFAFQYGTPDNVRWLLSKDPDTSCRDNEGRTILHAAAQTSSLEYQTMIDLAISHIKADLLSAQDFGGSTPFHLVFYDPPRVRSNLIWADHGCAKFEEDLCSKKLGHLLSKKMVGVNVQDNSGNSALHLACWRGLVLSIRILLQDGADPRLKDQHGFTPGERLRDQAIKMHLEKISHLLEDLEISNINPKGQLTIAGPNEDGSQSRESESSTRMEKAREGI